LGGAAVGVLGACRGAATETVESAAQVEFFEPSAARFFQTVPTWEVLGEGYTWSEGPAWDPVREALYFTDVPENIAYRWTKADGVTEWMNPSSGPVSDGGAGQGANGLWYARDGSLLLCNHGARTVEKIDLESQERTVLASRFEGQRFHSPNDVVEARDGTLYFTDPPYGLAKGDEDPAREMEVNGVYKVSPGGEVSRLLDDMTRPNGVALSPDEGTLYIAQSDRDAQILRAMDVESGAVRTLFDFGPYAGEDAPGLPDGMAVATTGEIFVTGPGGVFLIAPDGTALARILTGAATANCCFGEDGSTLFMTAHKRLLRIETKLTGAQWS
jgi:gluconolactonase